MQRFFLIISLFLVLRIPHLAAQYPVGGNFTSPGHPLIVSAKVATPYNSSQPVAASAILMRYWQTQDSVMRVTQANQMAGWLAGRTWIPDDFLEHKDFTLSKSVIAVGFLFRVIVRPDGLPTRITLARQTVDSPDTYSPESIAILEKEARRSISTLRFKRATTQDTILVPLNFSVR